MGPRIRKVGRLIITLLSVFIVSLTVVELARTQEISSSWSTPIRLSSEEGVASHGYPVADQYGFVHVFWREILSDSRSIIQYARFDGQGWLGPVDIYVSSPGSLIDELSPTIDRQDNMHLFWTEAGTFSESIVKYIHSPLSDAMSIHGWSDPLQLEFRAKLVNSQADSKGTVHLLYSTYFTDPGVYYIRSEDQGTTWSEPVWLDPDILAGFTPAKISFVLDQSDGLHATWFYISITEGGVGDWIRYAHSLDGGETWSAPFTIDREDGSGRLRSAAVPILAVEGRNVHVIWAAGSLNYRFHRLSMDAGTTWSDPVRIFGDLNGQAFDSLAVDAAGRVHFFGQVRFPQGIYHAVWDQDRWTTPSLIYFIRNSDKDSFGDRVHAHDVKGVLRAGKQIVVFFADPPPDPQRRLFTINSSSFDKPGALPPSTISAIPLSSPTTPARTQSTDVSSNGSISRSADIGQLSDEISSVDSNLQLGIYPALIFLIGIVLLVRWIKKP